MNLLLYLSMAAVGYIGTLHELLYGRTNKGLLFATVSLFILTVCSRIGYCTIGDDLFTYIDYFQQPGEIYFEPGYLFVTDIINVLLGSAPEVLVVTVSMWIVCFFALACLICTWFDDQYESYNSEIFCTCYLNSMLFFMVLYWGCFFAAETLRVGMAISLLYCSCALMINKKVLYAILLSLVAVLFHYSSAFFTLCLILMFFLKNISKTQYLCWFFILFAVDVVVGLLHSVSLPGIDQLFEMMSNIDMLVHYTSYEDRDRLVYMNTQYFTYHILGFLLIFGNLDDERYNKVVSIYFIGLTLGTVFQSIEVGIRIQWLFLSMIVFAFYYYLRDEKYSFIVKNTFIGLYAIVQQIMLLRVLGWHV